MNTTNQNEREKSPFVLKWREYPDEEGNTVYQAASPYTDGDGDPFYFRIRQRLADNRREFYEASDTEVRRWRSAPRTWASIQEAKDAMQDDANEIVRDCIGSQQ
ncbi:MAG: hypothetical protein E6Q97_00130 [Desulfurellales bacterium]|nr:MAG: hypothetical protein E6Q97_00130 [Desulfurellales bacterium]